MEDQDSNAESLLARSSSSSLESFMMKPLKDECKVFYLGDEDWPILARLSKVQSRVILPKV